MDGFSVWKEFFARWPREMKRRGIVVTDLEQTPFVNFTAGATTVLLERQAPDSLGARMVILSYAEVRALKVTEVVDTRIMSGWGFGRAAPATSPVSAPKPASSPAGRPT